MCFLKIQNIVIVFIPNMSAV